MKIIERTKADDAPDIHGRTESIKFQYKLILDDYIYLTKTIGYEDDTRRIPSNELYEWLIDEVGSHPIHWDFYSSAHMFHLFLNTEDDVISFKLRWQTANN